MYKRKNKMYKLRKTKCTFFLIRANRSLSSALPAVLFA